MRRTSYDIRVILVRTLWIGSLALLAIGAIAQPAGLDGAGEILIKIGLGSVILAVMATVWLGVKNY